MTSCILINVVFGGLLAPFINTDSKLGSLTLKNLTP